MSDNIIFNSLTSIKENSTNKSMAAKGNIIRVRRYQSPCGELLLGAVGDRLCLCDWLEERHRRRVDSRLKKILNAELVEEFSEISEKDSVEKFPEESAEVLENTAKQLDEFFAGKRRAFDVPLLFAGTDFQKAVWRELLKIPYGETISYGELARRLGRPEAVRAVANATGANAISIFVPCHRVIGSDRSLTGYAGGMEAKRKLLKLEGFP